jgi:hypothetical protein
MANNRAFDHLNRQLPGSNDAKRSRKESRMRKAQEQPATPQELAVKVRLDHRTVITCQPKSIAFWRARYPNLSIIRP